MPDGAKNNEAISVSRATGFMAQCASILLQKIWTKDFKAGSFCYCRIYHRWPFLNVFFGNWRINITPPQRVNESKHLSKQLNELFPHVASVSVAPCVCSLTNVHWQQSPSDKSLFSGCLRLSTYYGSWQFRTKLFTAKRNLPRACSCVNGEKMTGRLTAKRCGAAVRCGKKKKTSKNGAHLFLSSLIYRGTSVTTVYYPEVLLSDCMCWMFTFGSECFESSRWRSHRTYDNHNGCPESAR